MFDKKQPPRVFWQRSGLNGQSTVIILFSRIALSASTAARNAEYTSSIVGEPLWSFSIISTSVINCAYMFLY